MGKKEILAELKKIQVGLDAVKSLLKNSPTQDDVRRSAAANMAGIGSTVGTDR